MMKKGKTEKKHGILRVLARCLGLVILIAGSYIAYVLIDYHRIEDYQELEVRQRGLPEVPVGEELTAVSYNIGFGAYTPDFGFFMDGGTESRARSKEAVLEDIDCIGEYLTDLNADFLLLEEVDIGSTRSYQVEERELLCQQLEGQDYDSVFAQNFDSPYLFYPLLKPHGAAKSGLLTFSRYGMESSLRRSLPIETSLMKLLDLDRCYSVTRLPAENGRELVLYTLHLSAYTSDGTISVEQLRVLLTDMQAEYEKGNYCVAGGDFNKDLLGDGAAYFGVSNQGYTWAQPLPDGIFNGLSITLVAPLNEGKAIPSCRNADGPYHEGQYVLTVDGFLASDNVTVLQSQVEDTGFAYSDHNPVTMRFLLNEE